MKRRRPYLLWLCLVVLAAVVVALEIWDHMVIVVHP